MKKKFSVLFFATALFIQPLFAIEQNSQLSNEQFPISKRIQQFMDQESKKISQTSPFLLRLFKDGDKAINPAGIRISESVKQFSALNKFPAESLSGLLFYYELYNESQRVPHWHANAVEVGVVLHGEMKITIWEGEGRFQEFIVPKGGAWMIPKGAIHCLENVGAEELDFLVSYNSPNAEDRDFSTAWSALPESILAKCLGLSAEDLAGFKKDSHNRLSLYDPGDVVAKKDLPSNYRAIFSKTKPVYESALGSIYRLDEKNWKANQFMALQKSILKSGTIREPHWYRGSDAFLFVHRGSAYFIMMDGEGNVYNLQLGEGDLIFLPEGTFHTYVNIGSQDLEIYESFMISQPFSEIGIQDAAAHFRPGIIAGAMGIQLDAIKKIPRTENTVYMRAL